MFMNMVTLEGRKYPLPGLRIKSDLRKIEIYQKLKKFEPSFLMLKK
jgi:hypothetical protein